MRNHHGSANPNSKLTEAAVREIRESREVSVAQLAKYYGVSKITIYKVLSGERWKS